MLLRRLSLVLLLLAPVLGGFVGFPCIKLDFDQGTYFDLTPLAQLE